MPIAPPQPVAIHLEETRARHLIKFYQCLEIHPKPAFEGTVLQQAQQIRSWMGKGGEGHEVILNYRNIGLQYKELVELPPEIGLFSNLRKLDLSSNQLKALPPEIGNLTALTELHLFGNQLKALPPEISNLTALTELDLSLNQLEALPPQIGNLAALTELALTTNKLTALPDFVLNLSRRCDIHAELNPFNSGFVQQFQQKLITHRDSHPDQGPTITFSLPTFYSR
jgi:hypothetical protein